MWSVNRQELSVSSMQVSRPSHGDSGSARVSRASSVHEIELNDEQMEVENLRRIKWSQKSLPLSAFVEKYPLPQIVQIEEGYYGGRDDNSLSAGQVLKIHLLSSERKILCFDRHEKQVHIPLHTTQRVMLRPANYDIVFHKVADLAKEKPLPPYVEVSRGYYNVNSNVDYELSVEPGEKLRVLRDDSGGVSRADKKIKHMSFQNRDGVDIKIPYDCVAGFRPLLHIEPQNLVDVVAANQFPFRIEFVESSAEVSETSGANHHKLGVLACSELYDEELIIASCGYDDLRVVFTIPRNLKVTVKVAIGTLKTDPEYDLIRRSYHNFANLEENIARERRSKVFRSSGEIEGFSLASGYKPDLGAPPLLRVPEDKPLAEFSADEPLKHPLSTAPETTQLHDDQPAPKVEVSRELTYANAVAKPVYVSKSAEPAESLPTTSVKTVPPPQSTSAATNSPIGPAPMPQSANSAVNGLSKSAPLAPSPTSAVNAPRKSAPPLQSATSLVSSSNTPAPLPERVDALSVHQVGECLRILNLGKHEAKFRLNQIDGALLMVLDDESLKDLQLNGFERKKLLSFVKGWRPQKE